MSTKINYRPRSLPPERRSRLRRDHLITAGWVLLLLVLVTAASVYYMTRHLVRDLDRLQILGRSVEVAWTETEPLPADGGAGVEGSPVTNVVIPKNKGPRLAGTAVAWSTIIMTDEGFRIVHFPPGPHLRVDQVLAGRNLVNIYGAPVLRWRCSVEGVVSTYQREYCLNLACSGTGDNGYTVRVSGDYQQQDRTLTLYVTERLWSRSTRRCCLLFHLEDDGTWSYVGPYSTPDSE